MTSTPRRTATAAVTVALPVRDGQRFLADVLGAAARQRVDRALELLVVDSGSRDDSVAIARASGARVVEIAPSDFSHGGTRNLMMELAEGDHVAFLTQDAVPADERWLARLLSAFELAPDVALAFGPYRARADASLPVARELDDYFASFASGDEPVVQRLSKQERNGWRPAPGPLAFFSDANGCVARSAWERVPYRDVPYAEDQLLACEMLAAGYAKVYVPDAAVIHSHEYRPLAQLRRTFDEWRGLNEIFGYREPASPRRQLHRIRRETGADLALARRLGASRVGLARQLVRSLRHHGVRALGAVLGSRAGSLSAPARRALSAERRASFEPLPARRPTEGSRA